MSLPSETTSQTNQWLPNSDGEEKGKMTVAEAKKRFRESREQTSGFRKLTQLLIHSRFTEPFYNDSYLDALVLTEAMFEASNESICILCGKAGDGFISDLAPVFEAALERIKMSGGLVRVILLDNGHAKTLTALMERFPETLRIASASSTKEINHFIVCDGRMLRIEEIHAPLTEQSRADEVKARVYFNNPSRANMMTATFNTIWNVIVPKMEANSTPIAA